MPIELPLSSEQLLDRCRSGEKLETAERRQVVAYFLNTDPGMANTDMAKIFGVGEKTIRDDKRKIAEDAANEFEKDNSRASIADIRISFERQRQQLEKGRSAVLLGSRQHLEYTKALISLDSAQVTIFQKLGILPETADRESIHEYHFAAVVTKGDRVDSKRLEEFDSVAQQQIRDRRKTLEPVQSRVIAAPSRQPLEIPVHKE